MSQLLVTICHGVVRPFEHIIHDGLRTGIYKRDRVRIYLLEILGAGPKHTDSDNKNEIFFHDGCN
jgi:hypothetical protein